MSAKKRKRLEKYIEKKLKKEKRVELMEDLSKSHFESSLLVSSKQFGSKETKRQKLSRSLKETQAGLSLTYPSLHLVKEKEVQEPEPEQSSSESDESDSDMSLTEEDLRAVTHPAQELEQQIITKPPVKEELPVEEDVVNDKPAFYVPVDRLPSVIEERAKLPVFLEEQEIMETINKNLVTIICGETGCGKTTQVPQFLYEAGYGNSGSSNPGKIGVTQPRKVAAINMALRVQHELNTTSSVVSYQVRYDSTVTGSTVIKFMTDGILLKESSIDFLLKDYSILIIDEAHERNLNTDILIGLLSRIVLLRDKMHKEFCLDRSKPDIKPLRLIIMSATLRVDDFVKNSRLFATPPPIINVQARRFKVTDHFAISTNENYVSEAFTKVCQIHASLPHGGILVFLTGQDEIMHLCKKLREKYPTSNEVKKTDIVTTPASKIVDLDEIDTAETADSSEGIFIDEFEIECDTNQPLYVLPLFSSLNPAQQQLVFQSVPEGHRLCVVSTNVAETSLTIPNIKYVVDSGKVKQRVYDLQTGIEKFVIQWVSKASANQRSGRCGRTEDGHCYRLFSSAVYENQFSLFAEPDILRQPLETVTLLMKSMGIDNVINFPFPTPPSSEALRHAEKLLICMDALDANSEITKMGKIMAKFPIHPRFSKMILMSIEHDCLAYVISIVAGLSVGDIFLRSDENGENRFHKPHQHFVENEPQSDLFKLLAAIGAYLAAKDKNAFCRDFFLNEKMMKEIEKLRNQLIEIMKGLQLDLKWKDGKMKPPTAEQKVLLRQIFLSGLIDKVARLEDEQPKDKNLPLYSTMFINSPVKIHPNSSLFDVRPPPKYIIYGQVQESNQGNNIFIKDISIIDPEWLSSIGSHYCSVSKPLKQPAPFFDSKNRKWMSWHSVTFGPKDWNLSNVCKELSKK